jgi:hypothetical protein
MIGFFDADHLHFFRAVICPKRQGVASNYLDEHGSPGLIRFFVIASLERIDGQAVDEGEYAGSFARFGLGHCEELACHEHPIRSEQLLLPVLPQFRRSDPGIRSTVINPPGQVAAKCRIPLVPQVDEKGGDLRLLCLGQSCELRLALIDGHAETLVPESPSEQAESS